MLRELTNLILPSRREARTCEGCGQPFVCGASLKGCWCFEIKLGASARQRLRERYKDCLCRACLMRFTEEEALQSTKADSIDQSTT